MAEIRLQKFIASQGICSRRKAEELILAGFVKVNNQTITVLGTKIDDEKDQVKVKNKIIDNQTTKEKVYLILNKPVGYICSNSDLQGKNILQLLTPKNCVDQKQIILPRVYPVGRLDKNSEGLVILTNDGELTNQITHPSYEHEKEYEVEIDQKLDKKSKNILQSGMEIETGFARGIRILKEISSGKNQIITLVLREGKKRQIRLMFDKLGFNIISLKRNRINKLRLNFLPIGKWKLIEKRKIL